MNSNYSCHLPILKSDKEIQFYLKHGPKFGEVLKALKEYIESKYTLTYTQISTKFKYLCKNMWPDYKIKYPFKEVKNFYDEYFPGPICISINDTIAHGIDDITSKDIVSVDCGVALEFGKRYLNFDAAFTIQIDIVENYRWINSPAEAIKSISKTLVLNTMNIASIIESVAMNMDLGLVVSIVGHGIGRKLHESPVIHNARGKYTSVNLINNMCFCVEPVFVKPAGNKDGFNISRTYIDSDGWSLKTESGQPASHFETMFCVCKDRLVDLIGISEWI